MTSCRLAAFALLCTTSQVAAQAIMTAPVTTPAATAEQAQLCSGQMAYPTPWQWDPAMTRNAPQDATSGTPRIDQVRAGKVIATYRYFANSPTCDYTGSSVANPEPAAASGCGPFTRVHANELKASGDTFLVYPAIYQNTGTEDDQEPYIGPVYHGTNPSNITIMGVVQKNKRPVLLLSTGPGYNNLNQSIIYIDGSTNTTIRNINVACSATGSVATTAGAVFNAGGTNVTFADMNIHDCGVAPANPLGGNGVMSGEGNVHGFFKFDRVEIARNGGPGTSGNRHNVYIGSSDVHAIFNHVWSHDAAYGHEIKSRAWSTTVENSYLEGATAAPGTQAEAYLTDIPNGGTLVARGNVFRKGYSGLNSNGMSLTYAMEGVPDARPLSIDIENNTFIAFSETFDGTHPLFPMSFYYPQQVPGAPNFPVPAANTVISSNAFAGYCPQNNAVEDFRGDLSLTEALAETNQDYTLQTKYQVPGSLVVGKHQYDHTARSGNPRATTIPGAMD